MNLMIKMSQRMHWIPKTLFSTTACHAFPRQVSEPPSHSRPYVPPNQRKVKFNLDKLSTLTGYEKIELLRDMHRANMAEKSLIVYQTLYTNGLLPRLKYHDHHCMFHVLMKDPKKYHQDIKKVWAWMTECRYRPSLNLYKDLIACTVVWRDLDLGLDLFKTMKSKGMHAPEEVYRDLLQLHVVSSGTKSTLDGIALWNELAADSSLKPSLMSFCRAMELYGQVQDLQGIETVYTRAQTEISKEPSPRMHIENSYLSALVKSNANDKVQELYKTWTAPGNMLAEDSFSHRAALDSYNILLKMCHSSRNLPLALAYLKDMEVRHLPLDTIMYGRLISLLGSHGKLLQAKALFDQAVVKLKVEPRSSRHMKLQTSLLEVLCSNNECSGAETLFESMTSTGSKILKSSVKQMLDMYHRLNAPEKALALQKRHEIQESTIDTQQ